MIERLKCKSEKEQNERLASALETLAHDMRTGVYGQDGEGYNPEGYSVPDVVSDLFSGFEPAARK